MNKRASVPRFPALRSLAVAALMAATLSARAAAPSGASPTGPNAAAAALWARATDLSRIRAPGGSPLRLVAAVKVADEHGGAVSEGTYRLLWSSPERWSEETVLQDYRERRGVDGSRYWRLAPSGPCPLRIHQLRKLLGPPLFDEPERERSAAKIRKRSIDGIEATCVSYKGNAAGDEACFDDATGSLLRDIRGRGPYSVLVVERGFGDHQPFEGKLYPRKVRLIEKGRDVIEVSVTALERIEPADPSGSAAPAGAVVWPWCPGITSPERTSKVEPVYPESAKRRRLSGLSTIHAIVDPSGSVSVAEVVRSADPDLDASALDAVKRWRYRPASCDGAPVPAEILVNVSFTVH
jgi:TonB family protein